MYDNLQLNTVFQLVIYTNPYDFPVGKDVTPDDTSMDDVDGKNDTLTMLSSSVYSSKC